MQSQTAQEINSTTSKLNKIIKAKEVFDPRIIDDTGSGKSLWTTESVEFAVKGLKDGYKLKENPFLKSVKGAFLRKSQLPFKYSREEIECMEICSMDKEFFGDNFTKLKDGEKGWTNIELRPYQRNLLKRYDDYRWNIIMFPRQSGKTTTTVIEIVHFCCFNIDKDVVVIAQSDRVVNEILAKIKECFAGLPFFMSPGFVSFNKKGFVCDNGCRLSIGIAAESVVQGFALDLLYIDEFAYIKNSMVRTFWTNIYPALLNNPNSRCIITSTPNGRNMFFELWSNAEARTNKFIPYRIYWHEVPGRDEQFKRDTIANIGIEGWDMGFECSFDTQLKSIFNTPTQKGLRLNQLTNEKLWSKDNNPIGNKFGMEFISQSVINYDLKNDSFLLGIDLSEGLEQDSTTAKLKKIDWDIINKKLIYTSVGIFKSNTISVEDFAQWTMDFTPNFDNNKLRVIVENNTYGGEYFSQVKSLKMNNRLYGSFDNIVFAKFRREAKDGFEYGIRWNAQNKKLGVKSFSNLISDGTMIESHYQSIDEYLNFGKNKAGNYCAQYGHDDLVMGDVTIAHYIKSNNIYANAFLNGVKEELRIFLNDEDEEVRLRKEEELRKLAAIYTTEQGFKLRNSSEHVNLHIDDDIYLMMIQ